MAKFCTTQILFEFFPFIFLLCQISAAPSANDVVYNFRMCVPEKYNNACQTMIDEGLKQKVYISCVKARDRLECIRKLNNDEADFTVLEPEDMYIAANLNNSNFQVFKEIRTREEPDAEFRYKGVAVVRRELNIKNISSLKGLKSCHTGVGRNVGYKIPITKLTKMNVLPPLNDESISPRENEIKALSTFFSKACIVGKWAPDNETNKRLKDTYSNLCSLCENPEKCDYPDENSGYEGALRCLTTGGDVAWTKTIYVEKFFKLKNGKKSNVEDYAYLCPDGTKVPLGETPCTWAARPWPAFVSSGKHTKENLDNLRDQISGLYKLGDALDSDWFRTVLLLSNTTLVMDNSVILNPREYLTKAKYYDVIGRDVVQPRRTVRLCVTSEEAHNKCVGLKTSAYSRDIRPALECVLESSVDKCLMTIRDNGADIITVDATEAIRAQREYNLVPVATEKYDNGSLLYAVALVRSNSPYQTIHSLKGARSCHTSYMRSAGWVAPLNALLEANVIAQNSCPYDEAFSNLFSGGSCVPNAPNSLRSYSSLVKLCPNITNDPTVYSGPLKCLLSDQGDVAFTKHVKAIRALDEGIMNESDVMLLCPNGGRSKVKDYHSCNFGIIPPHAVLTSNQKSPVELDEVKNALFGFSNLYGSRPDLFQLFGRFEGKDDLLFLNEATGLESKPDTPSEADLLYDKMLLKINQCDSVIA